MTDALGRTFLPHDVPAGASIALTASFRLPPQLSTGRYTLKIDLVNEQVCWFSDVDPGCCCQHDLRVI